MIQYVAVLPAYAGMFPGQSESSGKGMRSPRVCGDVSEWFRDENLQESFSPRMRGCFPEHCQEHLDRQRSPRVCGDVSQRIDLAP